jgi:hypothetical protein
MDSALIAARAVLQREAIETGGDYVETVCLLCGADIHGLVLIDADPPIAGYVRSCNCDEPRNITESGLIGAAMTQRSAA